jgi:hypothetical protein
MDGKHLAHFAPTHLFIISSPFLPHSLNPWGRVFLWKLIVFPLLRESPQFLELNSYLPISQSSTTSLFPKPDWSNQRIQSYFLKIYFNIIHPSVGHPSCVFSQVSPPKSVCTSPLCHLCHELRHLILPDSLPWWCLVISADHEASHHVTSSTSQLFPQYPILKNTHPMFLPLVWS